MINYQLLSYQDDGWSDPTPQHSPPQTGLVANHKLKIFVEHATAIDPHDHQAFNERDDHQRERGAVPVNDLEKVNPTL